MSAAAVTARASRACPVGSARATCFRSRTRPRSASTRGTCSGAIHARSAQRSACTPSPRSPAWPRPGCSATWSRRSSTATASAAIDRLAATIAGFVVLQAVLIRFAVVASARLGERVLASLREDFVDRILALPLSTVERAGAGDLLTRTTRDVDALSKCVRFAVPETMIATLTVGLIVGALLLVSPLFAVSLLIAVPILVVGTRWYLRRAPAGYLRENASYSQVTDGLAETVEGARTVEALGRQWQRVARSDRDLRRSWLAERYTLFLRTVFWPVVEVGYVLPVVATLLAGGWLYLQHQVTLGQVTAAVLYAQMLVDPLDRLLSWLDEVQVGAASLARLLGVANVSSPRSSPLSNPTVPASTSPTCGSPTSPGVRCCTASRCR